MEWQRYTKEIPLDGILSSDGERHFRHVEGTCVQRVKVFAGYGEGVVNDDGEDVCAEVHWFQEESLGQGKHMIKKWLE